MEGETKMRGLFPAVCAGALIMLGTMTALAGDYADLKIIGFSADGQYLAFEESGAWDGSGGDYATTYYIDVEANKYAVPPTVFEWDMDSMKESVRRPLYLRYKRSVAARLNQLKIVRGNIGQQVVAHLLNDWSYITPRTSESYIVDADGKSKDGPVTDYSGGMIRRGADKETVIFNPVLYAYTQNTTDFYELTLTSSAAAETEGCSEGLRFDLTVKDNTHHRDLPIQILQKDGPSVPQSRHCPYGYHIEQVYFYKDRLAVFLNMFSRGFEGPDMRYMAVTGLLEYESIPRG
jgi:predicted secreted protein